MLQLYDFSIEYVKNAKLIPVKELRFGWKLKSDRQNVLQSAYQLEVKRVDYELRSEKVEQNIAQRTWRADSPEHISVTIPELHLDSCTEYQFTLTVWDDQGEKADLTHYAYTELLPEDWSNAEWIKPSRHITGWAPYLRTKFTVEENSRVRKAIMYACGLGIAEYYMNGRKTDDYYVDPPISNYDRVVYYRHFDVTDLIQEGGNALAVLLGEGFYSQSLIWEREERLGEGVHHGIPYGDVCAKIILLLYLENGSVQKIVTDTQQWTCRYSPVISNNIYAGEIYDARLETPDFAEYSCGDRGWEPVIADETPKGILKPCMMPPVRAIRKLPAVKVQGSSGFGDGVFVFDIGENIAGTAEFRLPRAPRGTVVTFRYTETLNQSGGPDHRSAGGYATQCIQQDMYICRGDEEGEIYRPSLGYHGFRYVEIAGIHDVSDGYCTIPQLSVVTGIQLSTDMEKTGDFTVSCEPMDRLYRLMDNTYRCNYHGIPEDCPAREKCGWLGDAQITVNWGLYNYDSVSSYEKYLEDIRTTVESFGTWKMISPGKRTCGDASPLWGCAQIVIPFYLYQYCGDKNAVLKNADLMKAWMEHEKARAKDYIIENGLGDWSPPGGEKNPRRMPVSHSSTMEFYEISKMMAQLCEELGIGERQQYDALAERIREALNRHFYDYDSHTYGYWGSDGAALAMGLCPDGEREALLTSLVNRIGQDDFEMPTGIFANKYLVPLLFDEGYGDLAFRFLFHEKHTGFGRMLEEGATTIWEGFDFHHVDPDRNAAVCSYNHPMHGGFLYCCHHHLAGIRPLEPGFAKFIFRPCFTENVDFLKAGYESVCGRIEVEMEKTANGQKCLLTIPAGSRAVIGVQKESQAPQMEILVNGIPYKKDDVLGSGIYEIFYIIKGSEKE